MTSTSLVRPKLRRHDFPKHTVLCEHCYAKCCRYFALPIDKPETRTDFDYMRWFLLHRQASVFTDGDTWYLLVHTECKHLLPDHRCGIYETRPEICREYSMTDCEFDDDWLYDRYFETSEQVEEYAEAILPRQAGESIRSPRPPVFPIIS